MHPYQLEVLASERHRELRAEAHQHHLARYARDAHAVRPRSRTRPSIKFYALAAFTRRCRRRVRVAFAADRSYLLDDRPIAGSSVRR